ncbi:hypothetical protein ACGF12_24865 [Kitasatospora sp. NPDC048296]|uniref:COG4315 family predicted lipoprotein n=1 Tax=Kitasatospora sp. NPDC048296 TaxID=3364048 RepID=UPI00371356CA
MANAPDTAAAVRPSSPGQILVDADGHTLYLFARDTPNTSTCYGRCASIWPPLRTTVGVNSSQLGTTKRADGTVQVTYNGSPLYYYVGDTKPGDVTGDGIFSCGAMWYAVRS